MEVLRTFFLPRFFHKLTFCATSGIVLAALDVKVRSSVRRWLHLPHDCPNEFIHSPLRFGGLGVPRFSLLCQYLREKRFLAVDDFLEDAGVNDEVREILGTGFPSGVLPPNPGFAQSEALALRVDGRDLVGAVEASASTAWLGRSSHAIAGWEYITYLRLYAGALPTLVRLSRGRRGPETNLLCRAGCGAVETALHIINFCPAVRGGVILRHHSVVRLLVASLRRAGHVCFVERTLRNGDTYCRPDIIAAVNGALMILDVTIVARADSEEALEAKRRRYGREWVFRSAAACFEESLAPRKVIPVAISWKGIWNKTSYKDLLKMGVSARAMGWMTQRVLRGGILNFNTWKRSSAANFRPP